MELVNRTGGNKRQFNFNTNKETCRIPPDETPGSARWTPKPRRVFFGGGLEADLRWALGGDSAAQSRSRSRWPLRPNPGRSWGCWTPPRLPDGPVEMWRGLASNPGDFYLLPVCVCMCACVQASHSAAPLAQDHRHPQHQPLHQNHRGWHSRPAERGDRGSWGSSSASPPPASQLHLWILECQCEEAQPRCLQTPHSHGTGGVVLTDVLPLWPRG